MTRGVGGRIVLATKREFRWGTATLRGLVLVASILTLSFTSLRTLTDSLWRSQSASTRTPNLAAVIAAVTGRPGWATGNAIVLVITGSGRRVAEAYDGDSGGAPLMHIEYTA